MEGSISSLMVKLEATVDIDDTVARVEEIVSQHTLSAVPVLRPDGRCFGIIRPVDLDNFRATGRKAEATRAWEICTPRVIEVTADTTIENAAILIKSSKAHHLLVKEQSIIRGIVHAIDILEGSLLNNDKSPTVVDVVS